MLLQVLSKIMERRDIEGAVFSRTSFEMQPRCVSVSVCVCVSCFFSAMRSGSAEWQHNESVGEVVLR